MPGQNGLPHSISFLSTLSGPPLYIAVGGELKGHIVTEKYSTIAYGNNARLCTLLNKNKD